MYVAILWGYFAGPGSGVQIGYGGHLLLRALLAEDVELLLELVVPRIYLLLRALQRFLPNKRTSRSAGGLEEICPCCKGCGTDAQRWGCGQMRDVKRGALIQPQDRSRGSSSREGREGRMGTDSATRSE